MTSQPPSEEWAGTWADIGWLVDGPLGREDQVRITLHKPERTYTVYTRGPQAINEAAHFLRERGIPAKSEHWGARWCLRTLGVDVRDSWEEL